nr:hypothetical protein [Bacillus velezensis]
MKFKFASAIYLFSSLTWHCWNISFLPISNKVQNDTFKVATKPVSEIARNNHNNFSVERRGQTA